MYTELSSGECPITGRVAEAGEPQTNSRPVGWQLAGPGQGRGWRPGLSEEERKRLREGSGRWLSYTNYLPRWAGQAGRRRRP